MSNKQLLALFVSSLVPWTVGNGLVPLLPVYAIQLGADPAIAGYYLAFSYLALAAGAVSAGWISDRFQSRRKPLIILGVISMPLIWLIGRVGTIWSLSLLTALLWFCGGLGMALMMILAGLSAEIHERGKIFGILSLTSGLGALIGGLSTGFITDRWGFESMFSFLAVYGFIWPLAALFLTDVKEVMGPQEIETTGQKVKFSRSYHLLFSASLIASVSGFIILLSRSLLMNQLDFSALAISSTGAISGLVAMPIPFLFGWLSDRTGRKPYLYMGYLAGIISLLILSLSISFWQFFIVMILQALLVNINSTVGNALVTDLVPKKLLARGLSLFGATGWIGGVLGFAIAGYALENLGKVQTFAIGITLPLIAIILLFMVRPEMSSQKAQTTSQ
jgi:MFS family permease